MENLTSKFRPDATPAPIHPTETVERNLSSDISSSNKLATGPEPNIKRGPQDSTILASLAAGLDVSIGTWTQSAFKIPSMLIYAAGDFGMRKQTRSPFLQPASLRSRANWLEDSSNFP